MSYTCARWTLMILAGCLMGFAIGVVLWWYAATVMGCDDGR